MKKLIVLGAAAAGYVLGSRAGRERYEEIRSGAKRFWSDPRVQRGADRAQDTAQQAGQELRDRVAERSSGSGESTSGGQSAVYTGAPGSGTA